MSKAIALAATLLLPLASELAAQPLTRADAAQGQQPRNTVGSRQLLYMSAGAAVGGLLALGYYQLSDGGKQSGRCEPWNCALPYLSISGALSGLFIARERAAERRATAPRAGEALEFPVAALELAAPATSLEVRDSLVIAATDSGAQLLTATAKPVALRRRGAGLSGVRSVAVGGADGRLLIGTATALWETPLTAGVLTRVADGPVDALGARRDVVVAASGQTVRVRRTVNGMPRMDSITAPGRVTAVQADAAGDDWWVAIDSSLYTLSVGDGTPTLTRRAGFTGEARGVTSSANWVAVALGGDGLALWPRSALSGGAGVTVPIVLRGNPRYAFDLAFVGDMLYVAGGVDGITQVEPGSVPRIVGASRQAGYATAIRAEGGVLWVGDRSTNRVLRIVP